jgi:hypothetical protein
MTEWWDDLDEIERATWVMVAIMAFGVTMNVLIKLAQLCFTD